MCIGCMLPRHRRLRQRNLRRDAWWRRALSASSFPRPGAAPCVPTHEAVLVNIRSRCGPYGFGTAGLASGRRRCRGRLCSRPRRRRRRTAARPRGSSPRSMRLPISACTTAAFNPAVRRRLGHQNFSSALLASSSCAPSRSFTLRPCSMKKRYCAKFSS
jgi:hypothetical protein